MTADREAAQMRPSYAVFFKTHFWDDFTRRQLRRLCAKTKRGDVYVVVDGTFGQAPEINLDRDDLITLGAEPVIVVSVEDLRALGLAEVTTHGSVIWYNPDYLNYVAAARLPAYDFYAAVEYDVVTNIDLDDMVDQAAADCVDYVGFALRTPARVWPWFEMHKPAYGAEMALCLSCLSVFSAPAMAALLARRQAAGVAFAAGKLDFWPNNEAFIPNELRKAGLKMAALNQFGETARYDWWPPTNEADLDRLPAQGFIHPVLHGTRFIRSTLFHEPSFFALLRPGSRVRQRLADFEAAEVRPLFFAELKRRVEAKMQRIAERIGLRPKWFAAAQSGAKRATQRASAHNAG